MEKKIRIFKTIAIVFIILAISLIAFIGVFRSSLNQKLNVIPDFTYGMELGGTREFKFVLESSTEEKEIYVDENGNYKGTVVPKETTSDSGEISLDATVQENKDEQGDVVAEETLDTVGYKTETRVIPANDESVLNQENYEKSKQIIQKRLDDAKIPEYNIRLDEISGNLMLEVPENDITQLAYQLALYQGNFEVVDTETGVVLLNNDDVKKASALYYANEGYQALLQIEFNKEAAKTLNEISKKYVKITNENDEETTKSVDIKLDNQTMVSTYFGEEITSGMLQITMGETTTDYDTFLNNFDSASYFANMITNGKLPNAYTLSSDNFVKSQITDDMINIAKIALAAVIVVITLILVLKYKSKGLIGAISAIGYVAVVSLALRYTAVTITLNSAIAYLGAIIVNYVFIFNFLSRLKTDSTKHAFKESIKQLNITIIPLWVVAVIFTFMTNVTISSVGMVMFWGLFVQFIYNFLITRTLYVD